MNKIKGGGARHSTAFWEFYHSKVRNKRIEYAGIQEAKKAAIAMLNIMNRKHIYDVRIRRRGNTAHLENQAASKGFKEQIMDRFMKRN